MAFGEGKDGHRHLLAIILGSQSVDSWLELLRQPLERDLRGVRLVIADGHAGLASAVWQQLPEAQFQRCTVHSTRNVFAKAPWRLRGRLGKDTTDVVEAPSPLDPRKHLEALQAGLERQVPEAMECHAKASPRPPAPSPSPGPTASACAAPRALISSSERWNAASALPAPSRTA
ncbi:hypothetical protein BHS05_30530 [Myxococcus xanthus]|nr:hypothetical protein BHS05_30530 [Myxococcus xanthus]